MQANILIEVRRIDKIFTYNIPLNLEDKIKIGMRCKVPFGKQILEGFIIKIINKDESEYELKDIISLIDDHPVLNQELLELGEYISKKTLCTLTSSYQAMLPAALKAKNGKNVPIKTRLYLRKIKEYDTKNLKEQQILDMLDCELSQANKISSYIVNKLLKNGIIEKYEKEVYRLDKKYTISESFKVLTEEQNNVITKVDINNFKPYLLHGVTGSGKTEVYMQLIDKVIKNNKEVIVLVPEISLTPQLVNIFRKRFGNIAILHSHLSDGEKYDEWRKIERKEVNIVVGARSAIFAPFTNLGLIIIDEEHSTTYKQENEPLYSAIDIAIKRAKNYNIPVILGSATPSIESYTRAKNGIYELLEMKNRVNNLVPKITLVDMKNEIRQRNFVFSKILKEKINDRLNRHEQIMIFLNRRGYTTILTCQNCGFVHKCPKCDIPLTYHLKTKKMHCHYCNYEVNKLIKCPNCGSLSINERGMGTEKLEEILKENFQMARIVRMDIDTTSNKDAHEKIIRDFEDLKYDILIGTQMISKGLDFPKVTLVGIINADATLNIPDFRSAERTFSLINQVSGRAGRNNLPGEVIIQGFNIDHYSLVKAKYNDYIGFYNEEMKLRKILNYPPFYNLCLIKIKGLDLNKVENESNKIYVYLKENIDDIILGPSSASVPKVNNNYFYQIIIKYKDTKKIYSCLKYISELYVNNKNVKVTIDFNPNKI